MGVGWYPPPMRRLLLSVLVLGVSSSAAAQSRPQVSASQLAIRAAELKLGPAVLRGGAHGVLPEVLVELTRAPATPAELAHELAALRAAGLEVVHAGGTPLAYQKYVVVRGEPSALQRASVMPGVRRIQPPIPAGLPSLDRSRSLLGAGAAAGARAQHGRLTGRGVVIADVDTLADVFHPDFFHGDGGWYDWIDVNGDGVFEPGVDGIDLDRDGAISAGEIAQLLRVTPLDISTGSEGSGVRGAGFQPGVDYLYLDTNGDGERSFGPAAGYTDDAPAFGEPLFVPDDVNQDGKLTTEERLVRLGTTKFQQLYARVNWGGIRHDRVYQRGADMIHVPSDITGGVYGYSDGLHGTGVLSIAAGGVALPSRRWVGLAPEADLVLAFGLSSSFTAPVVWALQQQPDILIHEASIWSSVAMDGTDTWSSLIDGSPEALHICPTGNIGGAFKHGVISIAPSAEGRMRFQVPSNLQQMELTLHVRGGEQVTFSLLQPGGAEITLEGNRPLEGGGSSYFYGSEVTARGTLLQMNIMTSPPAGDYEAIIRSTDASALTVHGYLSDEAGFSYSTAWEPSIATDESTAAAPSVASGCLGVGAVPAHLDSEGGWARGGPEAAGELRIYSGQGPRIDGAPVVDVVTPDNPWVAGPAGDIFPTYPGYAVMPHAGSMVFGGTSGAGPHAAGVAALLVQAGQSGAAALEAQRLGAVSDALTGEVPNQRYGFGRLDAALALGTTRRSAPPTVRLELEPPFAAPGERVRVIPIASDDVTQSANLRVRWDRAYDGTWDGELGPVEPLEVQQGEAPLRIKAQVWDEEGWVAEAAALVPHSAGSGGTGGAGGSAGAGGIAGAGGTAGAGAGGPGAGDGGPAGGSGCGCSTPQSAPRNGAWLLLVSAFAYGARRRRAKPNSAKAKAP